MKIIIIFFSLSLIFVFLLADTHIPAGNVNGVWTFPNSPFIIDGEISIQQGDELIIEPGVQVLFSGHYKFNIYGRILAEGTATDTISFTAQDTIAGWHSLRFQDTNTNGQDSSEVVYCKLEYGKATGTTGNYQDYCGGAIYCNHSSDILIKNCLITKNNSSSGGGGIYCNYSSPILNHLKIINNHSESDGGGVYCYQSYPIISNSVISDNYADSGGGIYCKDSSSPSLTNVTITGNNAYSHGGIFCRNFSSPSLTDVTISENFAYCSGGGIGCRYYSSPSLTDVTIYGNTAGDSGGGIYCVWHSSPSLIDVTISENSTNKGGGIHCYGYSNPDLTNVTIVGNTAVYGGGVYCYHYSNPSLTNVTIYGNIASSYSGGILYYESNPILINCILWNDSPEEIYGAAGSVTAAYSDIQGGWAGICIIDADPLFADPQNGDFHLTWANFPIPDETMSPCIDAGDPDSPFDPDGTVADMGAYYYDQGTGTENYELPNTSYELNNYPNPFNPSTTISFTLATEHTENTELTIYNLKGQKVKTFPNLQITQSPNQQIVWDGTDENNKSVSSGIYFYKLINDGKILKTKKMLMIK